MKSDLVVVQKYAQALLECLKGAKQIDECLQDLADIEATIAESQDLNYALDYPFFSLDQKIAVMQGVLKKMKVSKQVLNFCLNLVQNGRIALIGKIRSEFSHLADESLGRGKAHVVVSAELSDKDQKDLKKKLESMTGKTLELEIEVDPKLLGGFEVTIGNNILDCSVKGQLERLQSEVFRLQI